MLNCRQDAANQITSVSASVKPGIFGGVLISNGHLLIYFFEKDASNQEILRTFCLFSFKLGNVWLSAAHKDVIERSVRLRLYRLLLQ